MTHTTIFEESCFGEYTEKGLDVITKSIKWNLGTHLHMIKIIDETCTILTV